jgi:uncharacterized membrane protein YbjE (DUF340 family)
VTLSIVASLAAGIAAGLFLLPEGMAGVIQPISDLSLAVLLFAVGFDLGRDAKLGQKIKDLPKITLAVPFLIALGSVAGAALFSFLVGISPGDAALVGAGFGWYSLSAVIIAQTYDLGLGALALLTNVSRELLAFLLIPVIARRLGYLPAVAPGGATAMDVTLPIVSKSTNAQTALVAFYSGTVLSILVPIVVPLLIRLLQHLS